MSSTISTLQYLDDISKSCISFPTTQCKETSLRIKQIWQRYKPPLSLLQKAPGSFLKITAWYVISSETRQQNPERKEGKKKIKQLNEEESKYLNFFSRKPEEVRHHPCRLQQILSSRGGSCTNGRKEDGSHSANKEENQQKTVFWSLPNVACRRKIRSCNTECANPIVSEQSTILVQATHVSMIAWGVHQSQGKSSSSCLTS